MRRAGVAAAGVVAVVLLSGCTPGTEADDLGLPTPGPAPSAPSTPAAPGAPLVSEAPPPADPGSAAAVLATLPVKGRAAGTGYDRDAFGPAWADTDRNGCDTRNDVLRRDLDAVVAKPGTRGCVVATGTLGDPYSGDTIAFVRGQGTSELVQIDHVVSLSNAWQTGAFAWDGARRTAFANDRANLLAVDGGLNQQKGDGDAATWLPPSKAYRCDYVARQVAVKAAYGLWVTPSERDAMASVLARCPGHPLPADAPELLDPVGAVVGRDPVAGTDGTDGTTDPRYPSCAAAAAAGLGPYVAGEDVEYDWYRDGDGDGTVCE